MNVAEGFKTIRKHQLFGLMLGLILLVTALSILSNRFFTLQNIFNIIRQASINGIIAIGMTFVVLTAGIDLSVGAVLGFTAILQAILLKLGWGSWIVVLVGLLMGALIGLSNGVLISRIGIPPFIATLGMMVLMRGMALIISGGRPFTGLPDGFRVWGTGSIGPIPMPVVILFILYFLGIIMLHHTIVGERIYAIGDNVIAARFANIAITKHILLVYMISGVMATIAGIVLIGRLDSAQPVIGEGYELDAIAAIVIGGVSLAGGRGRLGGTLIGALIIAIINNGLNILNVESFYQQIAKGMAIIIALLLYNTVRRSE